MRYPSGKAKHPDSLLLDGHLVEGVSATSSLDEIWGDSGIHSFLRALYDFSNISCPELGSAFLCFLLAEEFDGRRIGEQDTIRETLPILHC